LTVDINTNFIGAKLLKNLVYANFLKNISTAKEYKNFPQGFYRLKQDRLS